MADTKISALTDGTTAEATDKIPVERGGANRYITPGYIKTYLGIAGTLSIASGKTFTASNTLTLAGTDSTTMTFPGTSGTVATLNANNTYTGVNTFQPGSDAQAGTFRRNSSGQTSKVVEVQTELNATLAYIDKDGGIGGNSLTISGNISSSAWTTSGIRYKSAPGTLTDTSSSGTVAAAYTNAYGGNTIAASNSTTFTNYYTTFITQPTAGTNVTFTNRWALGVAGGINVTSGQILVPAGTKASPSVAFGSNSSSLYARAGTMFCLGDGSTEYYSFQTGSLLIRSSNTISWSSSNPDTAGGDLIILRDASNVLAQRNSTTAQTFRVYRTYTDGSNYQRMAFGWNTSTALMMNEGAGTGADGSVAFNDAALATDATKGFLMIPSCAGAPTGTPADIPTGQIPIVFDSTNNKLYVYDGGWLSTAALT